MKTKVMVCQFHFITDQKKLSKFHILRLLIANLDFMLFGNN
jgi:hypothetical protein